MTGQAVIVGVDATPAGVLAATTGWAVATAAALPCRLVHVIGAPPAPPAVDAPDVVRPDAHLELTKAAEESLAATLHGHVPEQALDLIEVRIGTAAHELRRAVEEASARLLVLGGKHHAAPVRWFGGSTAHNAVRLIGVPLLVSSAAVTRFARILVAIDLSEAAAPTLQEASAFAALFDADLRVLTVVEPMPAIPDVGVQTDVSEQFRIAEAEARALVDRIVGRTGVETRVDSGSPARTIADEAAAWRADLVVVGSHGKRWVDRVLLGSTTERLLNRLPCSTLVIPVHGPTDG